ncbi:MAG TPA: sialate O-acetylesterase [Lacunisphaera sp.]|nr:sialate O-acetylesterase [Lacunisphaera sp.]
MKTPLLVLACLLIAGELPAAIELASPFGDHMVLQQGRPVPVWGTAAPHEPMVVQFGGQRGRTTAGTDGRWRIDLKPLAASATPRDLVVKGTSTGGTVVLHDVLVGEVWLCGGQSNMERQLGPRRGQKPIINWEAEVAAADYPLIRQFYVPEHTADTPQATTAGAWSVCSPATAADFSAVGFFFARDLWRARGVPVGIIHSAYGGTPAEAWTSPAGLAAFPEFTEQIERARQASLDPAKARTSFLAELDAWFRAHDPGSGPAPWSDPGTDVTGWETMQLPTLWEDAGHPDWDGVAWFHKTFELPPAWAGHDVVLHLSAIDDIDTTWVNGTEVGTTTSYNAQRSYRVPAAALKAGTNVIRVRVLDTGGGGGIWEPHLRFEVATADGQGTPIPLAGPWQVKFATPLAGLPRPPQDLTAAKSNQPAVLYNAMIAPLVPYALRGVTFYQGENNASRATQYRRLLPALIADWRQAWGEGDFPFLFVQIAPHKDQPPEIREAQLLAWQETGNTAMVVTIDNGDAQDIHPANKGPVGARLALAARALAYGEKLEYSGPVFTGAKFDSGRAVLSFSHLGGGLVAPGGKLEGFAVAGADGTFHPAPAAIVGDTVVVTAAGDAPPTAVRYGWAHVAAGNLFNRAGLPASPFRTDSPTTPSLHAP